MGENSHISWTDDTLNYWIGCQKTGSEACRFCYAENLMGDTGTRLKRVVWGPHGERQRTKSWLANSRKLERLAIASGRPRFVFSNSLGDIFDNAVPIEWLAGAVETAAATPHLIHLWLTKRPQNIVRRLLEAMELLGLTELPSNIAFGCTVVTTPEAERDVPILLRAKRKMNPAFVFISIEPMMEMIDLRVLEPRGHSGILNALTGQYVNLVSDSSQHHGENWGKVDWIIGGFESDQGGKNARPGHPAWKRHLRDQCAEAGTPFHWKQNGEFTEDMGRAFATSPRHRFEDGTWVARVGKAAAGRDVDGAIYDARPVPRVA